MFAGNAIKRCLHCLRFSMRVLAGKEPYFKKDVRLPSERVGSDYGGWSVVLDEINAKSIVYSFGVGEDVSFDVELIDKFNLVVHAFDPTPKSIKWVSEQNMKSNFIMHNYGIASFNGYVDFSPPENPQHVSYTMLNRPSTSERAISLPVKKLSSIMAELGHHEIDILKLDIEGAEYDVIADLKASKIFPGQILIEFHHRFPGVGAAKTKKAIKLIKSMGYKLFFISLSNEEYSFIRYVN
ncbi:MAG: FkbM family methyltransferase [Kiritimatiellia bacterium]